MINYLGLPKVGMVAQASRLGVPTFPPYHAIAATKSLPELNGAEADSQARSSHARKRKVLLPGHDKPWPGRRKGHQNCANCLEYLIHQREADLAAIEARRPAQRTIWEVA